MKRAKRIKLLGRIAPSVDSDGSWMGNGSAIYYFRGPRSHRPVYVHVGYYLGDPLFYYGNEAAFKKIYDLLTRL